MTDYCSILLNPATKSDLLSACIGADAAMRAAALQAKAANHAGNLTLAAGAFAIVAAFVGAGVTWLATQSQILSNQAEQSKQRRHDLKSEVYLAAVDALATGLLVIVRMSDLRIHPQEVLSVYTEKLGDLLRVHLVAEIGTAEKILACIQKLGAMHLGLMTNRPFNPRGHYETEALFDWTRRCAAASGDVMRPVTLAVAAMRAELDLPIDVDEYEKLLRDTLGRALAANEEAFQEILARQAAQPG